MGAALKALRAAGVEDRLVCGAAPLIFPLPVLSARRRGLRRRFLTKIGLFQGCFFLFRGKKTPRFLPSLLFQELSPTLTLAMVMFKKVKAFMMAFSEPEKVYCSGEKVAGRVLVEVAEVTRVSAVRVLACGVAKVNWAKGPQQCKQEMEYLRFEDVLTLEEQPTGEDSGLGEGSWGAKGGGEKRARKLAIDRQLFLVVGL